MALPIDSHTRARTVRSGREAAPSAVVPPAPAGGAVHPDLKHIPAAAIREGGFTLDDLKEIVLQQAVYCGVPAAHHALKLLAKLEP